MSPGQVDAVVRPHIPVGEETSHRNFMRPTRVVLTPLFQWEGQTYAASIQLTISIWRGLMAHDMNTNVTKWARKTFAKEYTSGIKDGEIILDGVRPQRNKRKAMDSNNESEINVETSDLKKGRGRPRYRGRCSRGLLSKAPSGHRADRNTHSENAHRVEGLSIPTGPKAWQGRK